MHAQGTLSDAVVCTGIIPEGFPHNIYTWRLSVDGTYEAKAAVATFCLDVSN